MRRKSRLAGAIPIALACLVLLFSPAALAQDTPSDDDAPAGAEDLIVRKIDATDPTAVQVEILYSGPRDDLTGLVIRENGRQLDVADVKGIDEADQRIGVAIVIDTSASMEADGKLARAREAAKTFVENRGVNDRIALVSFSSSVTINQRFTADGDALVTKIDELGPAGGTALYEAVKQSAGLFAGVTDLQPNIVLLSDGKDDGKSAATEREARGAAVESGATIFAVGLEGGDFDAGVLERLVAATGGILTTATEPAELASVYEQIQESLRKQYIVTYASEAEAGATELVVTVGGERVDASFVAGGVAEGGEIEPLVIERPGGIEFFRGRAGLLIGMFAVLTAVGLGFYALASILVKDESALASVLQPYSDGFVQNDGDEEGDGSLAQTPIIQRAVELTGQLAERQGVLSRVEAALERSNVPLRAAEALFFYLAAVVVLTLLGLVLTQSALGGLFFLVIAGAIPPVVLSTMAARRRSQFLGQLPDMLQLLSGTLRAGFSLMQGVEAVSQEVPEPMGRELRRVVTEARLGRPLESSLDAAADRMASPDFGWAVMAIKIQREVGGNLAELLLTVGETMTARERLRRDVKALTAEGRVSAFVLGVLPVALGFVMYAINPEYIEVLFNDSFGNVLLGGALVLALVGFYWMYKTIQIEI